MTAFSACYALEAPSDRAPRAIFSLRRDHLSRFGASQPDLDEALTPRELVILVNRARSGPLPTFELLQQVLPEEALSILLDTVAECGDEETIVAALFYLLADSEHGDRLMRHPRRLIPEGIQEHRTGSDCDDAVALASERWRNSPATADARP